MRSGLWTETSTVRKIGQLLLRCEGFAFGVTCCTFLSWTIDMGKKIKIIDSCTRGMFHALEDIHIYPTHKLIKCQFIVLLPKKKKKCQFIVFPLATATEVDKKRLKMLSKKKKFF